MNCVIRENGIEKPLFITSKKFAAQVLYPQLLTLVIMGGAIAMTLAPWLSGNAVMAIVLTSQVAPVH